MTSNRTKISVTVSPSVMDHEVHKESMHRLLTKVVADGFDPNTGTIDQYIDPYTFETVYSWISPQPNVWYRPKNMQVTAGSNNVAHGAFQSDTILNQISDTILNHDKVFVIAEQDAQAQNWILNDIMKTNKHPRDYVIVSNVDVMRGIRNPNGIFIGDWWTRSDILEIIDFLRISCDNKEKSEKISRAYMMYLANTL